MGIKFGPAGHSASFAAAGFKATVDAHGSPGSASTPMNTNAGAV